MKSWTCIEDLFYYLRNGHYDGTNSSYISDIVFEGIDFIKEEIIKIKGEHYAEGDPSELIGNINAFIEGLKGAGGDQSEQKEKEKTESYPQNEGLAERQDDGPRLAHGYKAVLHFEDDCEMENIRAFGVINSLKDIASDIVHIPEDINDNDSCEAIKQNGFQMIFRSDLDHGRVQEALMQTIFLKNLSLAELDKEPEPAQDCKTPNQSNCREQSKAEKAPKPQTGKESQLS